MKITSVKAYWLRVPIPLEQQHTSDFGRAETFDTCLVRIDVDNGLTGWGEGRVAAGSFGNHAAVVTTINSEFAPLLIGQDASRITRITEGLYSGTRAHFAHDRGHVFPIMARRGVTVSAISAIDIALWDLLGKSLGVPIHALLGGARVDRMQAYGSGGWAGVNEIGAQLTAFVARGAFKAIKMRVGVQDGSPMASAARVRAARAALGDKIDIMCDAHGTFTVSEAKEFCHQIRDYGVAWFEEPVTADDPTGLAEVRAFTNVPIAAGESESTRFDFMRLIERRAVDIVQPDMAICGGLSEGVRIGAMASAANLRLAPHLWTGACGFAAGLHLCATSPAAFTVEYSLGANPMIHDLIEESFPVVDGMIKMPTKPGLGITIKEDFVARYTV
jgi:L-alanine-DL-glutamate epimerase-like enolase superfamily enzyme